MSIDATLDRWSVSSAAGRTASGTGAAAAAFSVTELIGCKWPPTPSQSPASTILCCFPAAPGRFLSQIEDMLQRFKHSTLSFVEAALAVQVYGA